MLTELLRDCRAWTSRTVGEGASWTVPLPPGWLALAQEGLRRIEKNPAGPITAIRIPPAAGYGDLQPLLATLNRGRGFLVLDRIPLDRFSPREAQAIYWILGHLFGISVTQDVAGTLLFDVKDKGYDVTQGSRFSGTTAESSFHTDNAFGETIPDLVGLLCLRPAVKGGHSQLISAITVHNELLNHHADLLECLYQPFYFDRRGGISRGRIADVSEPNFYLGIRQSHHPLSALLHPSRSPEGRATAQ